MHNLSQCKTKAMTFFNTFKERYSSCVGFNCPIFTIIEFIRFMCIKYPLLLRCSDCPLNSSNLSCLLLSEGHSLKFSSDDIIVSVYKLFYQSLRSQYPIVQGPFYNFACLQSITIFSVIALVMFFLH